MNKPTKHAIAVVLQNSEGKTLFALRNRNEQSFPLVWSLPSAFMHLGESIDETIVRIGRKKLGIDLKPRVLLNEGLVEREAYRLFMHDYSAELVHRTPQIIESDPYEVLKWEDPRTQLASMDVMGDCCRLYWEYLEMKK